MPLAEGSSSFHDEPPKKKKPPLSPVEEHLSLVGSQGSGTSVPPSGGGPSTRSWVISHQRFLRALGFSVQVDGVWGPQSQSAWQKYLGSRGGAATSSSYDQDRRELMAFNRRLATTQAQQQAKLTQTLARFQAAQRSIQSKLDPALGASAAPRPHLGQLGIIEDQIARERQRQETVSFYGSDRGKAALTVMMLSEELAGPTPRRVLAGMSASNLRTLLFDPEFGTFRSPTGPAVSILQGYLQTHGHGDVRQTGRLDVATMNGLVREMQQLERQEYRDSVNSIRDLFFGAAGDLSDIRLRVDGPINLTDLPGFGGKVPTAKQITDRLAVNDPVSRRLLAELYRRLSVKQMAGLRYKLGHSQTLEAAEARTSAELMARAAREAAESGVLGLIARPFNLLADQVRVSVVAGYHDLEDILHGEFDNGAARAKQAKAQVGLFDTRHRYLGIATQLLADPTILIPGRVFLAPFLIGGKVTRTAALVLEEAGYRLSATGRIVELPGLALTLPARAGRLPGLAAEEILHGADAGVGALMARRVVTEFRHATRLLGDTRRAAHLKTQAALRRGFNVPIVRPSLGAVERVKAPAAVTAAYDDAMGNFSKFVTAPSDDLLNEAVNLRLSVFNSAELAGDDLSDFGRMVRGTYAASARSNAVLDLARERAEAAADALRSRSEHTLVQSEYERVFEETVEQAGPYAMGSSDLDDLINSRVQTALSAFDNTYLPALQRRIEAALGDLGESLWDPETLKFVGAKGEVTETLRKLGASSFADDVAEEVPNPLYGREFSHSEAVNYGERELRIRTAQKESWAASRRSVGDPLPEDWVAKQVAAIRQELSDVWREVRPGRWTDTRQTLRVAPHYARQYKALRELKPEPFQVKGSEDPSGAFRLSDVARSPRQRKLAGELNFGDFPLQMSVDRVASYFRFVRPEGDEVPAITRGYEHLLDPDRPAGELLPDEVEVLQMLDFQAAYVEFDAAYKTAYDAIFAQSLASEGALYSALRYSQHRPGRMLWQAAEGWLGLWRFMVLPLRFGWTAVNYIDNTVKALIQGTVNPKFWFGSLQGGGDALLGAAEGARSVFEAGWSEIRHTTRFFDDMFGTNMTETIDGAFDRFWSLPYDVHKRIFSLHGLEFPEEMLAKAVYSKEGGVRGYRTAQEIEDGVERRTLIPAGPAEKSLASFRDRVWDMMGNRPENFAKRAIYFKTFEKARGDGYGLLDAHTLAWAKVDETLFDYSKISTFEDNVRFIVPFVQWARKNNQFWLKVAARRPGLSLGVMEAYGDFRAELNEDLPEWMQRYIGLRAVSDVVARVPGLSWMVGPLADSVTDPINLLSVKNLYRFFKDENPDLPSDRKGIAFLDGFVDALGDFGFAMNPLVRKPLELSHVLSLRTWQTIFPQTSLIEAVTRKFLRDRFPNGLNLELMFEDSILQLVGAEPTADDAARNFDVYVRMEMAAQAQRGEAIDREAAQKKIADYFFVQQLVGYFTGIYLRRTTPEDIYYAQIADELRKQELGWEDMSEEDRANYRLWKLRKHPADFYRYVELLPLVHAYNSMPSYVDGQKFLAEHPELLPFTEPTWTDFDGELGVVARDRLREQTDLAFSLFDLTDKLDLSPETTAAAESVLVTPELRAFWSANDTPGDQRTKMLRGQYFHHLSKLNDAYHSIPDDDFDAKRGFLEDNPNLLRWWWKNNSNSDDFKVVTNGVLSDLRDRYFEYVEDGDWDGAGAFLSQFPFTFDHFDKDGDFVQDFETGRTQSQHAADFAKVKRWLDLYWSMPESQRGAWLESGVEGAAAVRRYFDLYGSTRGGAQGGLTQHAKDYLAAKRWLDYYFSLSPSGRSSWLNSGAEGSDVVLSYFKRYGSNNRFGRSFGGADPALLGSRNGELARRLVFWQRYFALSPADRPRFVIRNAEDYGVFVYGIFGSKERHDKEMAFYRRAMLAGLTAKAAHYLYVKPLLDFYFSLKSKDERRLFLRANPEVQAYFDGYSHNSLSGDAKLDKLIEAYFRLPEDSNERSLFLHRHPEVQRYFDKHSTPAERAIRNLLNVYFNIENKQQREKFLVQHPEISAYFDKRQAEREAERTQLEAFDQADPRYRPFRLAGVQLTDASAEWMRRILAGTALEGGVEVRRTRR